MNIKYFVSYCILSDIHLSVGFGRTILTFKENVEDIINLETIEEMEEKIEVIEKSNVCVLNFIKL